jgi:ABC-type transport system involved in multi-copper enzyme maturation permease subunit
VSAVYTVFSKELSDATRSRWLAAYAATFAVVALALALLQPDGGEAAQGFSRTTASLLNLCLLLVPLLALIVGAGSVAGERERGTLSTLLAQPLSTTELLLGKYCGLLVAIWVAVGLGFGAAGMVLALFRPVADLADYLLFVALAGALASALLSIGITISVLSASRVKALSIAVLTWFVLVLLYDLAAIGVAVSLTSSGASLLVATLLNPVEAIRILAVIGLEPDMHVLGPMGSYLHTQFGVAGSTALLSGATLAWVLLPLAGAVALFRAQDSE